MGNPLFKPSDDSSGTEKRQREKVEKRQALLEEQFMGIRGKRREEESVYNVPHRIDGDTVDSDFVVKVRSRRLPGHPHLGDPILSLHFLPDLDQDFAQMTKSGSDSETMGNNHDVSIIGVIFNV